ncbi:MAG TPA: nucleotidyltransferase domain-containing protein [Opitutales bacterium]|nr:nucleotidyltransferase domain-containing protein [Opitutales bacterium]
MPNLKTIDATELAEQAIRGIADKTLTHAKLILFGSRARGDASSRSDFDLAVFPLEGFEDSELLEFSEQLEESPKIIYPLDIIDARDASPAVLAKVRKEGRVWKN